MELRSQLEQKRQKLQDKRNVLEQMQQRSTQASELCAGLRAQGSHRRDALASLSVEEGWDPKSEASPSWTPAELEAMQQLTAVVRGHRTRLQLKREVTETGAATVFQHAMRAKLARTQLRKQKMAKVIQSQFRGKSAKRRLQLVIRQRCPSRVAPEPSSLV